MIDVRVPLGKIGQKISQVFEVFAKDFKTTEHTRVSILNTKLHAMPIDIDNINIMLTSVGMEPIDSIKYAELYRLIKASSYTKKDNSLISTRKSTIESLVAKYPIVLFTHDNIIIARNYDNIQKIIVAGIFSKSGIFDKRFHVGHTFIEGSKTSITPATLAVSTMHKYASLKLKNYSTSSSDLNLVINNFNKEYQEVHFISTKLVLSKEVTDKLAKLDLVLVIAQEESSNVGDYSLKEKALFNKAVSNITRVVNGLSPIDVTASPSYRDDLENLLINKLLGKRITNRKTTKSVSNKTKIDNSSTTKLVPFRLRSAKGSFQSVANLEALIRMSLYETIKKNMREPALTFQTGRFAESVELKSISYDNRAGAVTAFLTYMKYPYATFEPTGDRGSIDRSPSSLIVRSVREIATKLTKARMQAIII